jgi:hypothetical protein
MALWLLLTSGGKTIARFMSFVLIYLALWFPSIVDSDSKWVVVCTAGEARLDGSQRWMDKIH